MFPIRLLSKIALRNNKICLPNIRFLAQKSNSSVGQSGKSAPQPPSVKGLNKTILSTLTKEIKEEEKFLEKIVSPKDWKLEIVGNDAILTKSVEDEKIKVTFDVLATDKYPFADNEDLTIEQDDEKGAQPQFACIPELFVEITRPGKGVVKFTLNYEEEEDPDDQPYEDADEADPGAFEGSNADVKPMKFDEDHPLSFKVKHNMWVDINDVAYYDKDGKLVYKFSSDLFDFEFGYSMIEFLTLRGVNVDFLNEVMDLASKVDHDSYLKFLQGFKQYLSD